MKAMIFAAGLGTRLKPLTDNLPKALVSIAGIPLLENIILKLKSAGFYEMIVNVHHFPDQIIDFLKQKDFFGIRIEISDEREELLDTGGALKKAVWFFDDGKPFLVHNVDILSNLDLLSLYQTHCESNSMASLVVSKRETFRYLLFNENLRLCGWLNTKTGETKPKNLNDLTIYNQLAFSGIQVLSTQIFDLMNNFPTKFSIMDFYLTNFDQNKISAYIPHNLKMLDVGKIHILEEAERFVNQTI